MGFFKQFKNIRILQILDFLHFKYYLERKTMRFESLVIMLPFYVFPTKCTGGHFNRCNLKFIKAISPKKKMKESRF